MKLTNIFTVSLALIMGATLAQAQNEPESAEEGKEKKKKVEMAIRFLAVGQGPVSTVVTPREGFSFEKEIDPDLLPPKYLCVRDRGKDGRETETEAGDQEGEIKECRISLGVLGQPILLEKAGLSIPILLKETGRDGEHYSVFHNLNLVSPIERCLVLLYQRPGRTDWKDPEVRVFADDAAALGKAEIRVVNASGSSAMVQLGESRFQLAPGAHRKLSAPDPGKPTPYSVWLGERGEWQKIAHTAALLNADRRANMVIFSQRKQFSKKPGRVIFVTETVPAPFSDED